jgi:cell division protein FtsL
MIDLSFWNLIAPGFIFLALLAVLIVKGFGVIKLELTNRNRIRELRQMAVGSESSANKDSLNAIANQCTKLNSKWILKESDLDIAGNTYRLLRVIAALYHPESRTRVEEA